MNTQEKFEKSFGAADDMAKKFWDMWMMGLGSFTWSQEQMELMVKKYMDQRQSAREESQKVIEEMLTQVQNNQAQSQKIIKETVSTLFNTVDMPYANFYSDYLKKMQEMTKTE
ncbi:MAG: hypothetical protein PHF24_00605 [Syntrophomonas sp.]|nr:hypothetical protein [Syntrophomonas sp.]